jgi:hypothetical protein
MALRSETHLQLIIQVVVALLLLNKRVVPQVNAEHDSIGGHFQHELCALSQPRSWELEESVRDEAQGALEGSTSDSPSSTMTRV